MYYTSNPYVTCILLTRVYHVLCHVYIMLSHFLQCSVFTVICTVFNKYKYSIYSNCKPSVNTIVICSINASVNLM